MSSQFPIIIIGAGPIGLAMAAHLAHHQQDFLVFEAGETVGTSLQQWSHIKMFSSWALNVDTIATELLKKNNWQEPNMSDFPTGQDMIDAYLKPLSEIPSIQNKIRYSHKVVQVSRFNQSKYQNRQSETPFEVTVTLPDGLAQIIYARGVVDASGTWQTPNPIGGNGYTATGEGKNNNIVYGIPDVLSKDKKRYINNDTVVVGSGHSAINVILNLLKIHESNPAMRITWLYRANQTIQSEQGCRPSLLPERNNLNNSINQAVKLNKLRVLDSFYISEIINTDFGKTFIKGLRYNAVSKIECDQIIACTGSQPDLNFIKELQISMDHQYESPKGVANLINEAKKTGEAIPQPHGYTALQHPEPDFFIIGSKSHGRAPNFFLMSGFEQVRSISSYFAGDIKAAQEIKFSYPDDGICGSGCGDGGCCGTATEQSGQTSTASISAVSCCS